MEPRRAAACGRGPEVPERFAARDLGSLGAGGGRVCEGEETGRRAAAGALQGGHAIFEGFERSASPGEVVIPRWLFVHCRPWHVASGTTHGMSQERAPPRTGTARRPSAHGRTTAVACRDDSPETLKYPARCAAGSPAAALLLLAAAARGRRRAWWERASNRGTPSSTARQRVWPLVVSNMFNYVLINYPTAPTGLPYWLLLCAEFESTVTVLTAGWLLAGTGRKHYSSTIKDTGDL